MKVWPEYACAILEDHTGHLLLEARPDHARFAGGKLTCFGGRREDGETPEECVRRELREELNWEPALLEKRLELWIAGVLKAWFFHAFLDADFDLTRIASGHQGVCVPKLDLTRFPLSPWHAAILAAWQQGGAKVELDR